MKKALLTIILLSCFLPAVLSIPPNVVYKPLESLQHDDKERKCIAATLHSEARGEPLKGIRAVYDSILARMKKRNKTACEVVLEKHQYSFMTKRKVKDVDENMLTTLEDVRRIHPVAEGCDYFHSKSISSPRWVRQMEKCKVVSNHIFYRLKASPKEKEND